MREFMLTVWWWSGELFKCFLVGLVFVFTVYLVDAFAGMIGEMIGWYF